MKTIIIPDFAKSLDDQNEYLSFHASCPLVMKMKTTMFSHFSVPPSGHNKNFFFLLITQCHLVVKMKTSSLHPL